MCYRRFGRSSQGATRPMSRFVALGLFLGFACGAANASDWPQLQGNPQRTGYTPDTVQPPFKAAWQRRFLPDDRVTHFVQAVVYQGQVFVGTEQGNLYALGAKDGQDRWKFSCGSPILHTAACADGKVVVSSLGGVYAVETATGKLAWTFAGDPMYGFSAAPLIAEGTVYIGQRNGTFYALNLADGARRWEFRPGAPIFNTAAYDAGQVFFCDEKIRMHCLDAKTGGEVWQSEQLYGQSAKGYCPVIVKGLVVFRPLAAFGCFSDQDQDPRKMQKEMEATPPEELQRDNLPAVFMEFQDKLVESLKKQPHEQDLFILDQKTGRQAFTAPHFPGVMSLPGGVGAPAWDGRNSLILPWRFGGFDAYWGRLDLDRQRFVEILPPKIVRGNPDETVNVAVGGRMLFIMHLEEGNCQYTGIYDLDKKQCHGLPANGRKWEFWENAQGGNNAASIADGYFYHIAYHSVGAWTSVDGGAK